MTEISTLKAAHTRSSVTGNATLNLFDVPDTDVSIAGYRMVPIQPFTTGINPVVFQIDGQSDYVDLSPSYFELETSLKKVGGGNLVAAEGTYPANNLAHTMFKQIIVKFNVLMSPSTDTYHYKAMIETLLNHDRDDGETILKPQGWYNGIDCPAELTANNVDSATPHGHYTALPATQKETVLAMQQEILRHTGGKTAIMRFKPNLEVFHLNKAIMPGVQIDISMYFNSPDVFLNGHTEAGRLQADDVKVRFYLCTLRLNPSVYLKLEKEMKGDVPVTYPTVRSEIRTFTLPSTQRRFEANNLFLGRVPNRVVVGIVLSSAFTGTLDKDPFAFQKLV